MDACDKINAKWADKMDEVTGDFMGTEEEYWEYFLEYITEVFRK